jgi:hypothetical protein
LLSRLFLHNLPCYQDYSFITYLAIKVVSS